jgi:hypothetical protein
MSALDSLVDPAFAKDPPVKLNLDAKVVGIVLAILAGLGALLGLISLLGLLTLSAAFGGIFIVALLGVLVNVIGDIICVIGGWRMYQGNAEGKRLAVYGIALAFVAEIIYAIGFATGSAIVPLIVLALLYYAVVVSRFPSEARVQTP